MPGEATEGLAASPPPSRFTLEDWQILAESGRRYEAEDLRILSDSGVQVAPEALAAAGLGVASKPRAAPAALNFEGVGELSPAAAEGLFGPPAGAPVGPAPEVLEAARQQISEAGEGAPLPALVEPGLAPAPPAEPEQGGLVELAKVYAAIPTRLVGLAAGGIASVAAGAAKVLQPLPPGERDPFGSAIEDAYTATEEDLQGRLAASQGAGFAGFLDDVRSDSADNIMGIVDILRAFGPETDPRRGAKAWGEYLRDELGLGMEEGTRLVGGVVGGLPALIANPIETVRTRPITTLLLAYPALRAARVRGAPGAAKLAARAEQAIQSMALPDAAFRAVFGKRSQPRLIHAWFQRWLVDAAAQAEQPVAVVAERIMDKPAKVKAAIVSDAERFARAVKRGDVLPEEVIGLRTDVPEVAASIRETMARYADVDPVRRAQALAEELFNADTPHVAVEPLRAELAGVVGELRVEIADLRAARGRLKGKRKDRAKERRANLDRQIKINEDIIEALDELPDGDPLIEEAVRQGKPIPQRPGRPTTEPKTTIELVQDAPGEALNYPPELSAEMDALSASPDARRIARNKLDPIARSTPASRRVDVLAQAERRVQRPVEWEANVVEGGVLDEVIADLNRQLVDQLPRDALIGRRTVEPIMGLEAEVLEHRGAKVTRGDIIEAITAPLRDDASALLRSEKLRARVADATHKKYPSQTRRGVDHRLKDMAEATLLETPFEYEVLTAEGQRYNLMAEVAEVLMKDSPKRVAGYRAEAIRRIGQGLAVKMEQHAQGRLIMNEFKRFLPPGGTFDLPVYARNIAEGVLVDGEHPPLLLSGAHPRDLARHLTTSTNIHYAIAERLGIGVEEAAARVAGLADDLRFRYRPPDPVWNKYMPVVPKALEAAKRGGMVTTPPTPLRAVDAGFNSSMRWYLRSLENVRTADTLIDKVLRGSKVALTVLNPGAWRNIIHSNWSLLSMARGGTPVDVAASVMNTARRYRRFRQGDRTHARDFAALERTGVINTTVVDAELGLMEGYREMGRGAVRVLQRAIHKAGAGYRLLDSLPKLDIGMRNLRWMHRHFEVLAPGESVWLQTSKQQRVQITRAADGWTRGGYRLSQTGLDDLMARAAVKPGLDLFVDFSRQANFIHFLRSTKAGGLVSPFLSWNWTALDIPGLKKGLGHYGLVGDRPFLTTDSALLRSRIAREQMAFAGRRTVVQASLRAALLAQPEDELRQWFTRTARGPATVLVTATMDPDYLQFSDWTYAYHAQPTDTLLRLGGLAWNGTAGGLARLFGTEEEVFTDEMLAELPPGDRAKAKARRRLFVKMRAEGRNNFGDVLELAGLAGHPVVEMVIRAGDYRAAQQGRAETTFDLATFWRDFGVIFAGGAVHAVSDVAAAYLDEASTVSTRRWALRDDPNEVTPMLQWVVYRVFGRAWKTRNWRRQGAERAKLLSRRLTGSLLKPLKDRMRALERARRAAEERGDAAEEAQLTQAIEAAGAKMEGYAQTVEGSVEQIMGDFETMLAKMERKQKKKE